MAASEAFQSFIASLSSKEQEQLKGLIARTREDLLAARSEDARIRILDAMAQEARGYAGATRR